MYGKSFAIFSRHFVPIVLLIAVARPSPYYLTRKPTQELIALRFKVGFDAITLGLVVTAANHLGTLVGLVAEALAEAMVVYGAIQDLTGRRFSAGQSFAAILRRPLPVIGVGLCTGIGVALGLVLLIVPGLIVACVWCAALPACMAERTGVYESLSRSRRLTRGYLWRVSGAVIPVVLVPLALRG